MSVPILGFFNIMHSLRAQERELIMGVWGSGLVSVRD